MYAEVTVLVEGALEEVETFTEEAKLDDYIETWREDAEGSGYPCEVFVTYHEHRPLDADEECHCHQYLTDHRPTYAWNINYVN